MKCFKKQKEVRNRKEFREGSTNIEEENHKMKNGTCESTRRVLEGKKRKM